MRRAYQLFLVMVFLSLAGCQWTYVRAAEGVYKFQSVKQTEDGEQVGHGTCFAINKNMVCTAAHNLDGYKKFYVYVEKVWHECKEIYNNPDTDVAVLLTVHEMKPTAIKKAKPIKIVASNRGKPLEEKEGEVTGFMVARKTSPGYSGAPIIQDKKVIGMIVGLEQRTKHAICVSASALIEAKESVEENK